MSKTILIVDDSVSIRQMVSHALKGAGYSVIDAPDGQAGLDKARQNALDLVITDQNMPRLDGIGLVKALRADAKHRRTPILILTTEASEDMKAKGKAAGATGWLVKPFEPTKLLQVVQKVIG
jgi:two-component system chemotaxis response regulator CheY